MSDSNQYTNLIAGWQSGKPKFTETVFVSTEPISGVGLLANTLPDAFDLDSAIGAQLDAIGVRVGISRRVATPLSGVYFSFDIDGVGFDQGVWQGPYDPDSGISVLDDDTYRIMLKAKIAANSWDGTNGTIANVLDIVFSGSVRAIVQDNQDMTMTVGISGAPPTPILMALLRKGYLSVKPAGVRIDYYIATTTDAPLFGFDVNNDRIAGFDVGAFGNIQS
jgi:hypothetical protein